MTGDAGERPYSLRENIEAVFLIVRTVWRSVLRGLSGKGFSVNAAFTEEEARVEQRRVQRTKRLEAEKRRLLAEIERLEDERRALRQRLKDAGDENLPPERQ